MGGLSPQPWAKDAWELARRQHWVVTSSQLAALGMGPRSIEHRLASGRLHRLMRGIYVVGRPDVDQRGWWMAAVLACGSEALLSHHSAAALWGIRRAQRGDIHVVVPLGLSKRRPGIRVHRRSNHEIPGKREVDGIPITHPVATLVDLAATIATGQLEAAINEADHLGLVDPEQLRDAIEALPRWPGIGRLRKLLDGPTITLTSTQLERLFLPLAHDAGLPAPQERWQELCASELC